MENKGTWVWVAVIAAILLLRWNGGGLVDVVAPPAEVTAVTYVHDEKAVIPAGVSAALNELNTRGIMATAFPDDSTDGDNDVPEQYKAILPAAKAAGIPSLVLSNGNAVLGTLKSPTTKAQVLEAVP